MNRIKFYSICVLIVTILLSSISWAEKTELTREEKQWLSEHKIIKIAPDPYFPPIEHIDKDGNYIGISAEFMKIIENELGIEFQVIHCKDWEEVLQKAKNREVDMLPAAAQTPQREKYMLFSTPYLEFPGVIISTKDSEDIKTTEQLYDKTVAIVSGYVWEDFFSLHHPQINVIPVNSLTEGLRKVSTGIVDAMIGTLPVVLYYIEKEGITNLRVTGETGYYTKLSILTRKDWPLLNSIMKKTLQEIPDKKKKVILQKWISIERKPIFERRIFWIILISILALSMVVVSVIYTWNVILKKQVTQKTQELKEDIIKRKQAEEKIKKTMDTTIDTMSKMIEAKDPYTAGHQHRVCQLAVRIARELNLSEDKIEGIRIASLIHDIGKIGLPAEILSKPTKLNDVEYSLIRNHSQMGYDILKSIDFSYSIAEIVLQHHERINGSGYPRGLKGDEILIEAKIMAVADVVEAMSSHRPYRPALGVEKALEEISQNKGILYDPEIVDICLKLFKEKEFKFELQ